MSTTATVGSLNETQQRILTYLREHVETKTYFKSRLIAEDLDLTAKEVGTNMSTLQSGEFGLSVEKWGYSSSTTWMVSQ
ncbi:DUF7123 family protein [Halalkalicoccus jeotgali]|uniref:DUF7123 domain-containing protein n=1 Tax=Halalkalicoccus jeotgali (strain DSM 18796 / CECT 7217 / JCM 14584 / KCTC 4019 / B3) TaxID=795797 RepID=D8J7J6_HALJB|nr:hypothetical protein [Halalkalicoccus jeotgali]ADJ16016.1 hypothetical protein HacjB3_13175 [Halalkalicoccus jeotgali B3]ELY38112.1 hypothetical protein C497_08379 [Halalkalicoccus jeotgali B3]